MMKSVQSLKHLVALQRRSLSQRISALAQVSSSPRSRPLQRALVSRRNSEANCAEASQADDLPASHARSRPFARCPAVPRRPLALALLLAVAPGALLAPATVSAQPEAASAVEEPPAPQAAVDAVNINTASAEELADRLSGIGASKAEAIIRYREQFGPFESVDELSEVTGIGAATVERNRVLIRLR
jgi:competence protein ComEA